MRWKGTVPSGVGASLTRRLAVARGDEPADVVIRGGRVLSVFTREWLPTDVAVVDGYVAGLGDYDGREVIDATGRWVVPGLIDAHMHLESSKLLVDEFARLVLPFGTTAVVADPHEIANVLGTDGVHWLIDVCGDIPLDVYFMASSCVPASRFESPRRELTPRRPRRAAPPPPCDRPRRDDELPRRDQLRAVGAREARAGATCRRSRAGRARPVAQRLRGRRDRLGPRGVHARGGTERLRAGMWLLIREATAARNLHALLPLLAEYGPGRIAFCTDDREPEHIADDGHLNGMVRDAVAFGIPPEDALVCASLNPALWHGLPGLGAVAPGYRADLLVLPDLERFVPELVLKNGAPVAEWPRATVPDWVRHTVRIGAFGPEMFRVPWNGRRRTRDRNRPRPDRHRLPRRADPGPGRRGARRPGARPGEDRGRRASPGDGPCRPRLRAGLRPAARRDRVHGRPRRAQRRRRRDERRFDGGRGATPREPRRRHRRRRRSRGARGAPPAGRRAALRRAARGGRRRSRTRSSKPFGSSDARSRRRSSTFRSSRSP